MTCCVAVLDEKTGDIYMGGDSAGVSGLNVTLRADEKVFFVGSEFLISFTSSFRMGQILRYKFNPPPRLESGQSDMQYMVCDFIDAVRNCFVRNGYGDDKATWGGNFLVGYRGNIYNVQADHQVGLAYAPYEAVGCGEHYAKGALFALEETSVNSHDRVTIALTAASTFSGGVSPPFVVLRLPNKKVPITKVAEKKKATKSKSVKKTVASK